MQDWSDNDEILMYCAHNEGKSVIAERFTKALKAQICKKWHVMIKNLIFLIWIN